MSEGQSKLFNKFTKTTFKDDGRCSIDCVKGLWGVSAPTEEEALREARHYFGQYYLDGEYNEVTRNE